MKLIFHMEKETTITINGKQLKVKQSFRSLMLFEEMTQRSVYKMNETVNDTVTLFYCILKGNNKELFTYSFDQFVDLLDDSPEYFDQFNMYLLSSAEPAAKQTKKKSN